MDLNVLTEQKFGLKILYNIAHLFKSRYKPIYE